MWTELAVHFPPLEDFDLMIEDNFGAGVVVVLDRLSVHEQRFAIWPSIPSLDSHASRRLAGNASTPSTFEPTPALVNTPWSLATAVMAQMHDY